MRIFSTVAASGEQVGFCVLGSCNVFSAAQNVRAEASVSLEWNSFDGLLHTPLEAAQQLQWALGRVERQVELAPLLFRTPSFPSRDGAREAWKSVDVLVCEVSTQYSVSLDGVAVNVVSLQEVFVRKKGLLALDWWRSLVRSGRADSVIVEKMLDAGVVKSGSFDESIARDTRFDNYTEQRFVRHVQDLQPLCGRVVLVPRVQVAPPGSARHVADRQTVIDCANAAARLDGVSVVDLSEAVFELDPSCVFTQEGRDLNHYTKEFKTKLGRAIVDRVHRTKLPC